jgi:hypothetical protein
MIIDHKYVVFKRRDYHKRADVGLVPLDEDIVTDAVVIRRQDMAAPPILDAYASFYLAVKDILESQPVYDQDSVAKCKELADYFHAQAAEAWNADRKFPD